MELHTMHLMSLTLICSWSQIFSYYALIAVVPHGQYVKELFAVLRECRELIRFSNLTPQHYDGRWTITTVVCKNFLIDPDFIIY